MWNLCMLLLCSHTSLIWIVDPPDELCITLWSDLFYENGQHDFSPLFLSLKCYLPTIFVSAQFIPLTNNMYEHAAVVFIWYFCQYCACLLFGQTKIALSQTLPYSIFTLSSVFSFHKMRWKISGGVTKHVIKNCSR